MDDKYANSLSVAVNYYDIGITFQNEKSSLDANGEIIKQKEEVVTVRMSPQLAKSLRDILDMNIKKYESEYGIVPTQSIGFQQIHE